MPRPIDGAVRALLEAAHDALDLDALSYPTYRDYLEDHRERASWVLAAINGALAASTLDAEAKLTAMTELLSENAPRGEHNRRRDPGGHLGPLDSPAPIPIPESADLDPKIRRQVERSSAYQGQPDFTRRIEWSERRAEPGELCTCGRQAIVVYLGGAFGPTGDCGIRDGGDQTARACSAAGHATASSRAAARVTGSASTPTVRPTPEEECPHEPHRAKRRQRRQRAGGRAGARLGRDPSAASPGARGGHGGGLRQCGPAR